MILLLNNCVYRQQSDNIAFYRNELKNINDCSINLQSSLLN